jgi:putative sigma-54 modulation protein
VWAEVFVPVVEPEGAPMRLQVKTQRDHVSDSVKDYVEKRIGKLDRRLYSGTLVEVTLGKESNPSIADGHWVEAIVYMKGPNLVAKEHAPAYEAAVDRLVDKLERQLDKHKNKRIEKPRRDARQRAEPPPVSVEEIEQHLAGGEDEAAA